jgi:hypothetical protein
MTKGLKLKVPSSGNSAANIMDIIIPNFNGGDLLVNCVKSVMAEVESLPYYSLESKMVSVTVVDDCSTDSSEDIVTELFPQVRLVKLAGNVGFVGACDAGIQSSNAIYCFLLNNDAWMHEGSLQYLLKACLERKAHILTPKVLWPDGSYQTVGISIDLLGFVGYNGERWFYFSGAALIIEKSTYLEIGGFDLRYYAYMDEIDLQWRARLFRKTFFPVEESIVYHIGGATFGGASRIDNLSTTLQKQELQIRNALATLLKNYYALSLVLIVPLFLFNMVLESFGSLLLGKPSMLRIYYRALRWNVVNIRSTLVLRKYIQRNRKVSDFDIIKNMDIALGRISVALSIMRKTKRPIEFR